MADEIPDAIDEVIDDESEDEEDELIRLRHLLARSRQEHTEQNEKLREFKVTVDKLSAEINEQEETHQAELELVRSEVDVIREEAKHTAQMQEEHIRQLRTDAAAMSDMDREVCHLRERVAGLLDELEIEGRNHAEESHRLTKESFSLRIKLESTFRKTLQEIDGKYKEQAFAELANDSKNALVENSKLEEELAIQSIGIESLLERYKKQNEKLVSAHRDATLSKTAESMRLDQLRKLKQERLTSEARVNHLQENVDRLNELRAEYERVRAQLTETEEELSKEREIRNKEVNRAEKWKQRTFDLSKQMLELTTIQPMKNDGIAQDDMTPQNTERRGDGGSRGSHGSSRMETMSNSSMWSASANDSGWRGGVASMATLHAMDQTGTVRVRGQGPGGTTILRKKAKVNYQSLPSLMNPGNGNALERRR